MPCGDTFREGRWPDAKEESVFGWIACSCAVVRDLVEWTRRSVHMKASRLSSLRAILRLE